MSEQAKMIELSFGYSSIRSLNNRVLAYHLDLNDNFTTNKLNFGANHSLSPDLVMEDCVFCLLAANNEETKEQVNLKYLSLGGSNVSDCTESMP